MGEGATTEIGPLILFRAKVAGTAGFDGKFTANPYSWHQKAHMLFVDQPRYVGFSFGTGPYVLSSVDAGLDMVTFLRGWRFLFPEMNHASYVLASESYGGHYVPAWTKAILDFNQGYEGSHNKIQIAEIMIGNGIVNQTIQNENTFV